MDELTPIKIVFGEIVVDGDTAFVAARGDNVVALEVTLSSKYAKVSGATSGDDGPGVLLSANEWTLDTNNQNEGEFTIVRFAGFEDWSVWAAEASRYSVLVCLVKRNAIEGTGNSTAEP